MISNMQFRQHLYLIIYHLKLNKTTILITDYLKITLT